MKEEISSNRVKTLNIEVKANKTDTMKTNYKLIYSLLNAVVNLLNGEAKSKLIKISCQMDQDNGERMFSLFLLLENPSEVNTGLLKKEFEQQLDACITVLNPLLTYIMKLLKGSFRCARVDLKVAAKFKFRV